MIIMKNPICPSRVIREDAIRKRLVDALSKLPATGIQGGISVRAGRDRRNSNRPRALIYWGPLPFDAEDALRPLVKPTYDLSHIRSVRVSHKTATSDNPHGY